MILVCPNRTCKNFENRLTNKVFMAKMDFALAREIIDDRENAYIFREFLPDHEDFVSGMSFASIYNNFEQS